MNGYSCVLIHICSALEELIKFHSIDINMKIEDGEKDPFALTEEEENIYLALYEKNVCELLRGN